MTDQTGAPAVEEPPEQEIDFQGRKMWVRMPRSEQLLVWRRTLHQLENTGGSDWTADTVMAALERLRKIIDTVLVNKVDITWLDDQFLDSALTFQDITPIVVKAIDAFADAAEAEGNREDRRAAKATKKAVRKKAATS